MIDYKETILSDPNKILTIKSKSQVLTGSANVRDLNKSFDDFNDHVESGLAEFHLFRITDAEDQETDNYSYSFLAKDGRAWKQTLIIKDGKGVPMDFTVVSKWEEPEFRWHRDIRATVIALVVKYKTFDITCRWS